MTTTFESLGVPQEILAVLNKINFVTPTPIQEQAIPMALDGTDILGSAQTGTGKTAAFTIPLLAHLLKNPQSMALIVAPTRELATQISQAVMQMTDQAWKIRCALLIGGDPMSRQMHALQQNPRIIIGTPGRINDHLKRRSVNLSRVDYLVLDETDRMLDMGFGVQIDQILTYMPGRRQTMLFSATLPSYIVKLANKYMQQPQRIAVGSTTQATAKVTQETMNVPHPEKYGVLTAELEKREGTVIVFVKTKRNADRLAGKLEKDNHNADAIHGDLRQNRRDRVIRDFRAGKTRILVATDVAARGLDVPHVAHVINYDLPQSPEDFIHRIGRTGRNGAEGFSLSFISNEDGEKWHAIQRLMNPDAKRERGDDAQRGPKPFKKKGGGFKHKRREWNGPRRHRKNDHEARPNEGRYQQGGEAPGKSRRHDNRKHEGRRHESRDQQPRENRDRWGNNDRNDGWSQSRPERPWSNRDPRHEKKRGHQDGNKRPHNRDDRDGNRDNNRGQRPHGKRPRNDGNGFIKRNPGKRRDAA